MKFKYDFLLNKNIYLIFIVFIISVVPSSRGTDGSSFIFINFIATVFFYLICLWSYGTTKNKTITLIFILGLYFLSTVLSGFSDYTYGQLISFLPVLFVFSLNFKNFNFKFNYIYVVLFFLFVSVLGWFSLFDGPLSYFVVHYYSSGYEGMVSRMIAADKAVSIFGTHSIAGFYYNLFSTYCFYLMWNQSKFRLVNFIFILNFQAMNASLISNTSLSFSVLFALSCICIIFFKMKKEFFVTSTLTLFSIIVIIFLINHEEIMPLILGGSGNGLSSRYFEGVLQTTIEYILSNPLIGIGFSYSDGFYYTDSSYIAVALKVGIIGSIVFHVFAFNSISSFDNKVLNFIFIMFFMFFSVAYPIFNYYRFIGVFMILLMGYKSIKGVVNE
ncbi:hypothetical protein CBP31_03395 [Oceanisphaera profunda]|uniref:Uncharacterized protein n=1 Tax=Oceanisphaera profunda TaxID=1416627 RepID=A0A1Y0D2N4_9GAMM|nr:hypothetical protein [Oceanisphaera profunda]ART81782.1 hypothetical protein CBP31_03395 [Oceanisphaera profunda]